MLVCTPACDRATYLHTGQMRGGETHAIHARRARQSPQELPACIQHRLGPQRRARFALMGGSLRPPADARGREECALMRSCTVHNSHRRPSPGCPQLRAGTVEGRASGLLQALRQPPPPPRRSPGPSAASLTSLSTGCDGSKCGAHRRRSLWQHPLPPGPSPAACGQPGSTPTILPRRPHRAAAQPRSAKLLPRLAERSLSR
jgi:hypothetical protein